ncbi:hypothetical protein GQ44DRAFT_553084, partial [Phaeosphaeriaceae sp. PMI808]
DWPNRRTEIMASTVPICALSIVFLVWRIVHGLRNKRKLLLCDYLLILAAANKKQQLINVVATGVRFKTTSHGLGRHIQDPSIVKPYDLVHYIYFLWIGQVVNILAVAVLKYSICVHLLALNFSRIYRAIIWFSILLVTAFNLVLPTIGLFSCTPFEKNWNRGIKGRCFAKGGLAMVYTQGVSNVITDIVYVVAPIIYLSIIKLPGRTQLGLRVVFCLGLIATLCSIMKISQISVLRKTRDPSWDGTDLAIWSASELSVGIFIASLPPLRKQFDRVFRAILPTTWSGASKPP